jgi:glycosyltransferase involved in cell wall biosynthesis
MKLFWESKIDSPVYKIMHGVDCNFFKPNANIKTQNEKSIICVGSWCRDFNLLYELWLRLYQFDPGLSLTLISSNDALKNEGFNKLLKLPNVTHKTGLDSNQLLEAYQSAYLHVLPLSDGVANNALVESLATACPVLVTDAGSSIEYIPSNHFGLAIKGDVDDHYQKAVTLLRDPKLRNDMAIMQRQFALSNLSWPNISQYVLNVIS